MSKATLQQLNNMDSVEYIPGFHGKMIHTERMTMAYWDIEEGASIHVHQHPHEQVVNMLEGVFELEVDGVKHKLKAGDVFSLPSQVPHGGKAITPCKILDVFSPPREEYR